MMNDVIRGGVAKFVRLRAVCLCVCVLAATVRVQQADLNAVAAKVAQELKAKKTKSVAVFDFVGPGEDLTALGQKLADDFSAALAKSGRKLHVENRARLARSMKESEYGLPELTDPNSMSALTRYLEIDAAVLGTISSKGNEFKVEVRVSREGKNGAPSVETEHFSVAASDEMSKLEETYVARSPEAVNSASIDKTVPNAGTKGYSYPRCVYCPQAGYSEAAVKAHIKGTVSIIGVVSVDGRITDVRVIKHLPAGLSAKAVEAVEGWKLEPARGPDGEPVAVRQVVEVTFHLY